MSPPVAYAIAKSVAQALGVQTCNDERASALELSTWWPFKMTSFEVEMREIVGLRAGGERSGVDAYLDFTAGGHRLLRTNRVEVNNGSRSVSTARDVGSGHIARWRSRV